MTLNLPQYIQNNLFENHDLWTNNLDTQYRFETVLASKYWNRANKQVGLHRVFKGRQMRRWPRSRNSLNFK